MSRERSIMEEDVETGTVYSIDGRDEVMALRE